MRVFKLLAAVIVAAFLTLVAFVHVAPEAATRVALDLERDRSGLVRKEIELPGGLRYAYLDGGSGEPLVLLHGFGADKDNFTRVARFLVPRYRVIVPDHVGFGESSHPMDADYSPPAQAERLHALVGALGLSRVHVGGSSMGGHIAMSWALAHPDEVASLWLLDPGGIWSAPPSELWKIVQETGRNPLMARSPEEFRATFEFVMADPPYVPGPMLDAMARARMANFELEQRVFDHVRADRLEDRLKGLATPSLIVWGRLDRAIHVGTADVLHGLLPNSKVVIYDDLGHLPMIEDPRRSADDYLAWRASLG